MWVETWCFFALLICKLICLRLSGGVLALYKLFWHCFNSSLGKYWKTIYWILICWRFKNTYWIETFKVTKGKVSGKPAGKKLQANYWRASDGHLIGETLQVNYWRATASELIGEPLQVKEWIVIASQLIGETLQVNYWRVIASQLLERHCRWTLGELLPVNYWRGTAGKFLRHCNASIGKVLHFTCPKNIAGQHWETYCNSIFNWILVGPCCL